MPNMTRAVITGRLMNRSVMFITDSGTAISARVRLFAFRHLDRHYILDWVPMAEKCAIWVGPSQQMAWCSGVRTRLSTHDARIYFGAAVQYPGKLGLVSRTISRIARRFSLERFFSERPPTDAL